MHSIIKMYLFVCTYIPSVHTFLYLGNSPVLHVTNFYLKDKLAHCELPKLVQPGKRATVFAE